MEPATRDDPLVLAEDAWAYYPPTGAIVREDLGDAVCIAFPNIHYSAAAANRMRFTGDVDARIDAVRRWMGDHGREKFIWIVGEHAEPADLVERLLARGAIADPDEPESTPMVLDHEPSLEVRPGIVVRRVETFDDYRKAMVVSHDAWEESDEFRISDMRDAVKRWQVLRESTVSWTYLALMDGVAVGYGTLARLDAPAFLLGNAGVVPEARGLGVYSALIKARWADAQQLGAPALVITAGEMSRPLLAHIGFRAGPPIRTFIDDATPPAG